MAPWHNCSLGRGSKRSAASCWSPKKARGDSHMDAPVGASERSAAALLTSVTTTQDAGAPAAGEDAASQGAASASGGGVPFGATDMINIEELAQHANADGQVKFCRCWKSSCFPLCAASTCHSPANESRVLRSSLAPHSCSQVHTHPPSHVPCHRARHHTVRHAHPQ